MNNISFEDVMFIETKTIKIETTKNNIESIGPNHLVFFFATYINTPHRTAIKINKNISLLIIFPSFYLFAFLQSINKPIK
jgi:hypothetical protein